LHLVKHSYLVSYLQAFNAFLREPH
jgi:hypothetical protein